MDNAKLIAEAWEANRAEVDNADGFISLYARLATALEQADARIETLESDKINEGLINYIEDLRSRIAELEKAILAATDMLPLCPGCLHHKEAGHASGCIVETIKKGGVCDKA